MKKGQPTAWFKLDGTIIRGSAINAMAAAIVSLLTLWLLWMWLVAGKNTVDQKNTKK